MARISTWRRMKSRIRSCARGSRRRSRRAGRGPRTSPFARTSRTSCARSHLTRKLLFDKRNEVGCVEHELKELVRTYIAYSLNCRLLKQSGRRPWGARRPGQSLERLLEYARSNRFTRREKVALRYADAILWNPQLADDALWADLHAEFSEPQIVELASGPVSPPAGSAGCTRCTPVRASWPRTWAERAAARKQSA